MTMFVPSLCWLGTNIDRDNIDTVDITDSCWNKKNWWDTPIPGYKYYMGIGRGVLEVESPSV